MERKERNRLIALAAAGMMILVGAALLASLQPDTATRGSITTSLGLIFGGFGVIYLANRS